MTGQWRIGALVALTACSGNSAGQSSPQACVPIEAAADSALGAGDMAGEYALQLVATSGAKRGSTAGGKVRLMAHDREHKSLVLPDGSTSSTYTFPFYGTTNVDLAAVGAVAPGEAGAEDPDAPGVLVIESPGRVMLRLGSEANRAGVRRFDGAFTALQVQQVTEKGFSGTWQSGVAGEQSGGHFCANRVS